MTLSRLIPLGTAASFLALVALAPVAPVSAQEAAAETAAELAPAEALKERSAVMKSFGGANRALAPLATGQSVPAAAVLEAATAMHDGAVKLVHLFPAGSSMTDLPKSESLPVIWSDSEGFAAALAKFEAASKGLQEAAEGGDSAVIAAAFAELRPTCGGCHQTYRKPKD